MSWQPIETAPKDETWILGRGYAAKKVYESLGLDSKSHWETVLMIYQIQFRHHEYTLYEEMPGGLFRKRSEIDPGCWYSISGAKFVKSERYRPVGSMLAGLVPGYSAPPEPDFPNDWTPSHWMPMPTYIPTSEDTEEIGGGVA